MYSSSLEPRTVRRGIILILVLGMLGLMALIGVTFAVFAGQSLINGRNFAQGVSRPQAEALMDYALAQLINDTNIPTSGLRGHSLLRDMYGNDSLYRGNNPPANAAVETGGLLTNVYVPGSGTQPLHFTGFANNTRLHSTNNPTPFFNQLQYVTNIPATGQYYGLDFTRWIVRFPFLNNPVGNGNTVSQSFEILEDDSTSGVHVFTLAGNLANPTTDPTLGLSTSPLTSSDWTPFIYDNPNFGAKIVTTSTPPSVIKTYSSLSSDLSTASNNLGGMPSNPFILDGRYMRAFNGPGLTRLSNTANDVYPYNVAAYANFRLNGSDPDAIGMDEDYDACDLENWYLAIQSADGQVVIPSFHRPGILMAADWTAGAGQAQRAKILRPRQVDNSPLFPPDPLAVDINGNLVNNGQIRYDVDNDGDGTTDSVWLDLGYPVQREPGGRLFKPLFAFMCLGLNGRLPLNTAGNLQARAIGNQSNLMLPGNMPYGTTTPTPSTIASSTTKIGNSTTQVPYPGFYVQPQTPDSYWFHPQFSSNTFLDAPLWDHTSHLGYSVNEINPKFALQNAPSNAYTGAGGAVGVNPYGGYPSYNGNYATSSYSQYDNAGVSVALTQLRNLLAGTVPTDVRNPIAVGNLSNGAANGNGNLSANQDLNVAVVDGLPYILPNNVADGGDIQTANTTAVARSLPAVAGRWGEPQGIPTVMPYSSSTPIFANVPYPIFFYNNPVRAGKSVATFGSNDVMDDDFDGIDPPLAGYPGTTFTVVQDMAAAAGYPNPTLAIPLHPASPPAAPYTYNAPFIRNLPEFSNNFDRAGQIAVASERSRRYVIPEDPAGVGRVVAFMKRPTSDIDYGTGSDTHGRNSFFRYFRPPGLPQEILYPYANSGYAFSHYPYTTADNTLGQRYMMPVLLPEGYSGNNGPASKADRHTNVLHGYQSMLTPNSGTVAGMLPPTPQVVAAMGALPFDWDLNLNKLNNPPGDVPLGYGAAISLLAPSINPYIPLNGPPIMPTDLYVPNAPVFGSIGTLYGPNLGSVGNPSSANYPIPYANYGANSEPYGVPYGPNAIGGAPVVNGYLGGSLNKDEADEMNLYSPDRADQPYGPTDVEWLYRKHDVDGATLTSRLSRLAPVSFLNPADGLTRRRLFSTDAWDLNSFAYANDNPPQYAGAAYSRKVSNTVGTGVTYIDSSDHDFTFNSRFVPNASPSLEVMNQVAFDKNGNHLYGNFVTTEFLPNPTLPPQSVFGNNIHVYTPNTAFIPVAPFNGTPINLPLALTTNKTDFFSLAFSNAQVDPVTNVIIPAGDRNGNNPLSAVQVQTPSLLHRDRKINLNFPLPISNDPAEPVRQKWCRETYQMLKAILPPASVDTPEELAALSQFVVNIVDFRDPDCSMTRFVNTDLEVTDVLTKQASPVQGDPLDLTWTVSPPGVRFSTTTPSSFPYDPGLYSPDAVSPFLVQHGMEYNPIAINEAMAYQAQYGVTDSGTLTTYQAMFIELVNTLTEEQNNTGLSNASSISLRGWDIIMTPDNYGWGRPDPIGGDVNPIALPPLVPLTATSTPVGDPTMAPLASQRPHSPPVDSHLTTLQGLVQQFSIPGTKPIQAMNDVALGAGAPPPNYYVIGDYRAGGAQLTDSTVVEGSTPVANITGGEIDVRLPLTFNIPVPAPGSGQGLYYWVYLRRPANPFDTDPPNQVRPNKEMVVVDAMRFPVIDAGAVSLTAGVAGTSNPTLNPATGAPNAIFSAQRLQPHRGGHLIRTNTLTPMADQPMTGHAATVTTICPPSPAYAYGYTEQMAPPSTAATNPQAQYKYTATSGRSSGTLFTSQKIQQSINNRNTVNDVWCHLPFHDRDFASVAELLLVPGCPPGLFSKQFVEEPYPGNILDAAGNLAPGTDNTDFAIGGLFYNTSIVAPKQASAPGANPSLVGRQNFNANTLPANPTFPYLPDNFYYTAASVAPPIAPLTTQTQLTTEIGGWTGAGWHKMLEFFEVPSSANGAIGNADNGSNFDWFRADRRPGQVNLNLIIDEEVFAGVFDDPRLNEVLAGASSTIPFIVSQIDQWGYPAQDAAGNIVGRSMIFNAPSVNFGAAGTLIPPLNAGFYNPPLTWGRGYVYRDPNIANYDTTLPSFPTPGNYQQVHGIKAAFSDFLKLRHGGSGYLFGYGAGPTGSGDVIPGPLPPPLTSPNHPIAAERPFRSLSYPDINYTILRPASLPPSPKDSVSPVRYTSSTPPLPSTVAVVPDLGDLTNLFQYLPDTNSLFPFVALNPVLAPMHESMLGGPTPPRDFPYVQDSGIKNPFLAIQYGNVTSPLNNPTGSRHLGPPYATLAPNTVLPTTTPQPPQPAPFPPPIPPTPARRLFQIPDVTIGASTGYTSNASLLGQYDIATHTTINGDLATSPQTQPTDAQLATEYPVNKPTITPQLSVLTTAAAANLALSSLPFGVLPPPLGGPTPPSLVDQTRAVFQPDNVFPQANTAANNYLGAGPSGPSTTDHRMHPLFRTEMLQKVTNLTTVRTHQFAVWITVGFFEVVKPGTAELGITDVLGQEVGLTAGKNVRYRSFFVIDRTKATGFNPYYPGNFRDCVSYRRRIE